MCYKQRHMEVGISSQTLRGCSIRVLNGTGVLRRRLLPERWPAAREIAGSDRKKVSECLGSQLQGVQVVGGLPEASWARHQVLAAPMRKETAWGTTCAVSRSPRMVR